MLGLQGFRQIDHSGLGGAVGLTIGQTKIAGHTAAQGQLPAALFQQHRQGRVNDIEGADQVDVDQLPGRLNVQFLQRCRIVERRQKDDAVDTMATGGDLLYRLFHRHCIGHIHRDDVMLPAQRLVQRIQLVLAAGGQGQSGTLFRKLLCQRMTNAGAGPDDPGMATVMRDHQSGCFCMNRVSSPTVRPNFFR